MGLFGRRKENQAPVSIPEPQPGQTRVTFEGLGMHCAGCRSTVEMVLQEVPGVHWIQVDLKEQSATVIYDSNEASTEELRSQLAEVGFPPESETDARTSS